MRSRVFPLALNACARYILIMKTTQTTKQGRDKANGQYAPAGLDKLCGCGHTLGQHSANRTTVAGVRVQECFEACNCECFKAARKPK